MSVDFLADARAIITNGPFTETIKYWPYQGAPRDIPAILNRNPPEIDFLGGGSVPTRRFTIEVIRSNTDGIADPNLGNDQVELKVRKTDLQPEAFRITRELGSEDDDGPMLLEVVQ